MLEFDTPEMTACVWQDSYERKKESYVVTYLDSFWVKKLLNLSRVVGVQCTFLDVPGTHQVSLATSFMWVAAVVLDSHSRY